MSNHVTQPRQLAFYKGSSKGGGAMQFNLQRPHFYCDKCKAKSYASLKPETCPKGCDGQMSSREGCVFVEITSAKGVNDYDWENKIVMALSIHDIGKILNSLESGDEVKLFHDPGAKSDSAGKVGKTLTFSSPKGTEIGSFVTASMKVAGSEVPVSHKVGLNRAEVLTLQVLLEKAITSSLAW